MTDDLLIIFARNPRLGQVKSRLATSAGPDAALQIYKHLLDHTRRISADLPGDKVVFLSEPPGKSELWGHPFHHQVQKGRDLGERMLNAFRWGFDQGYRHICIIGSDCYELTTGILKEAFNSLKSHEAVIGPTHDGGYYLLGIKELHEYLFHNKNWSTPQVIEATLADLKGASLTYKSLKVLNDVDYLEDLPESLQSLLH